MGRYCRQFVNFRADISPANAGMAARLHVVTKRQYNLLDLQRGDRNSLFRIFFSHGGKAAH